MTERNARSTIFCFVGGLFVTLLCSSSSSAQDSLFVRREGNRLVLGGRAFYAIGVNSYFLQNLAAYNDTSHLIEVFRTAQQLGLTTVRTWGFYDGEDSTDAAVIQFSPGRYNERGLRALDYVVAKAREYSLRLIIPLVNNWDEYGGMNQYVRWRAQMMGSTEHVLDNRLLTGSRVSTESESQTVVQKITGAGNRSYVVQISSSLGHDDFYRDSTIKTWYKNYVSMILNRINVYTGLSYKDDPTILMWELANEPRSSDRSGVLVMDWIDEMSRFVKSIDENHLIGTGEEGHDISSSGYSDISHYNNRAWLFNGSAGVSFRANTSLPAVDVASVHCYTEDWGIQPTAGIQWLLDHQRMSSQMDKPLIVGEIGIRRQQSAFFDAVFNTALHGDVAGVLPWEFVYEGRYNNDGYAFSCPANRGVCPILSEYARLFQNKRSATLTTPSTIKLYPNYPNPFNYTTLISFDLAQRSSVLLSVYNLLGQSVATLLDEVRGPGRHALLFDAAMHASGVYIIQLTVVNAQLERKMLLIK